MGVIFNWAYLTSLISQGDLCTSPPLPSSSPLSIPSFTLTHFFPPCSVKLVIGTFSISGCEIDSGTSNTSNTSNSSSNSNVAQILYQPAASRKLLRNKPLDYKPLGHSPGHTARRQPVVSAEITISHVKQHRRSESDLGMRVGRGSGGGGDVGVFDNSVSLRLQQTVVRFDRKTALRLAAVGAMLTSSFNVK